MHVICLACEESIYSERVCHVLSIMTWYVYWYFGNVAAGV
jgi:hypothetical protein